MGRFVSTISKYVYLLFLLIGGLLTQVTFAQSYSYQLVLRASNTDTKSANITATGSAFHQLTWNKVGTVSVCSVRVDSSSDGVTWGTGDIVAAQDCSSNGQTISTSHVVNYIRINVTSFTGSGQVASILDGFINNPSGGSGNVVGSGLTSGNIITGAGGSNIQDSGSAFANLVITNPSGVQSITANSAGGINLQTIPCASLNANTQTNAGCTAAFSTIVVNSISSTANNLRKGLNIYYEGNGQQGTDIFGLQIDAHNLQDANTNATAFTIRGLDVNAIITGNNTTNDTLYGVDSRPRLYSNASPARLVYYHGAANSVIPAGSTVPLLQGIAIGANIAGTVTSSTFIYDDVDNFQYGGTLSGSIRGLLISDATTAKSGICHGVYTAAAPMVVTEHDCWMSGTGSPASAVTGNIGSIYSQQNGTINTSLWVKESGTGNTGWASLLSTSSWAVPGTIGSTTPNTGAFTTLSATGNITLGAAGGTTGTATFNGSTSGTATITAPAVAGTSTNPFAFSNSINLPSGTAFSFNSDVGFSRASAGSMNLGNGTAGNTTGTLILSTITGSGSITAGSGSSFIISTRSKMNSAADSNITLQNNAGNAFARLQFGGTTSSFTALCTSATTVIQCLGDGTAGGSFGAGGMTPVGIGTPTQIYNTAQTSKTASQGATTMFTVGATDANFKFHAYVGQLNAGTGCAGNGSVAVSLLYTDPITGTAYTQVLPVENSGGTAFITTLPLTSGALAVANTGWVDIFFRAKTATTVQYSTTYTAGASCSTGQAYNIYPDLEAL